MKNHETLTTDLADAGLDSAKVDDLLSRVRKEVSFGACRKVVGLALAEVVTCHGGGSSEILITVGGKHLGTLGVND